MIRAPFLLVTVVGCLLGMAMASACGHGLNPWLSLATVLLAATAHAGGNVLNDYHDALSGADAAPHDAIPPYTGGSQLIQTGRVFLETTRQLAWTLLGLSAFGGLGEITIALVWWLVILGADYVHRREFFLIPAYTALPFALLVANLLLINGLPDARSDRRVGKHTLAVRLGPNGVAGLYLGIAWLAHAWLAVGVWLLIPPTSALWGLVSLPISLVGAALLWRHRHQPQALRPAIVATILAVLVHGLALAAGFASMS